MNKFLLVLIVFCLGCVSSTVQIDAKFNRKAPPTYEDYFDGYLLGWAGSENQVNLAQVCMDQKPYGTQKLFTGEDAFFTILTLGIYTPTTVRVWCGE